MKSRFPIAALLALTVIPASAQERPRSPQGGTGTVTLSVNDYDRLVDRASQPEKRPDPPPVPAVVARADLRGRAASDTMRGTLRLEGEVFHRGQVKVALVAGATLLEARADRITLPLVHEGDVHSAVLTGPGPFALTVEWAAPLTASPGRASVALPSPAAGSVSATIDLPGDPAEVRIEPGIVTRRQTANGRTAIEATLEPGRPSQVTWSVREAATQAPLAEVRTLADVRSLVTIGEADVRMVSLIDVTVVQGEPRTFQIRIPSGYDVSSVTGSSIDVIDPQADTVSLTVRDPSQRRHQFLVSLDQTRSPGSFKLETSFPALPSAQREVGEAAVAGTGTIEVIASGDEALRRMDVREVNASLRSLARQPLLAAFRYQRRGGERRTMTLDVKRFADAAVIPAAVERAVATTLVTSEGRTLTELSLTVRNRAQPFMRVALPPGARVLSVEVAGETAKPVNAADGTRVPLLRTGFKPQGPYNVSFVYLHEGAPFARKGETQMVLPQMDVPITVLTWELFLPEKYSLKPLDGNVLPAALAPFTLDDSLTGRIAGIVLPRDERLQSAPAGRIVGRVVDGTGTALPGATVIVTAAGFQATTATDALGRYAVDGVPSGYVTITSQLAGFADAQRAVAFDQTPQQIDVPMATSALSEVVTVTADAVQRTKAASSVRGDAVNAHEQGAREQAPSQNVVNLQRRVAGVLPVRIDVPRAGTPYEFVKPLVLDEETKVSFRYKRR